MIEQQYYGVTNQGFNRKRLPEQLQEIYQALRGGFGDNIALTPDSVLGILAHIEAERLSAMWEEVEDVYGQMYPMSASGSNLDRAVSFMGVTRLQAEPSAVDVVFYGSEGVTVPNYTSVRNISSQTTYYTNGEFRISKSKAYDVLITTPNRMAINDVVALTINGVTTRYQTTRSSAQYAIEELGKLLKKNNTLKVTTDGITLRIQCVTVPFIHVELVSGLSFVSIGTLQECLTEGASTDVAKVGQVSEIVTMVTGLERVENLTQGASGRFEETDSELYVRYPRGVYQTGAGTAEAILANLLKLKGVSEAFVYENDSSRSDEYGTPANSLHCIVKGGLDTDIAQTILRLKPAGIPTFGTSTVQIKDSQQIARTIQFSRPKKRYIWVKVVADTFVDQTEFAKSGYIVNLTNKVMEYANTLSVGADVVLQRIIGKCVEIEGIGKATVTLGVTNELTDVEPQYRDQNIKIAPNEEAVFDKSIILVS
ncbi:MAG: baseplate J/gp47 family protein [Haemophilus influenzae]|nr:baseplate J/gp47 family protein [Haemophilus influenzae]